MKRILVSAIVGLMVLSPVFLVSAYADTDWWYWNTESIEGKLIDVGTENLDSVHAKIESEWRWDDDISNFKYQHIDVGLTLKKLFAPWFSLGLNYRQVWDLKSSGWLEEERPHINGTISFKLSDWKIKNRSRVEYRVIEDSDNVWRFRNKTSVEPPIKWTEWGITPYVADEIFIVEDDGLYRNRLYAGLAIGELFYLEHLKGDIFFCWQVTDKEGEDWDDHDLVIGTKLKVHF